MDVQELGEPLPRMFVLGVVVVRQHRGAHVPLEVLQRQVAPLSLGADPPTPVVNPRSSCNVRRRPSASSANSCTTKETPLLEVLDEILDRLCPAKEVRSVRDVARHERLPGGASLPAPEEPLAILVFGHEVAPRTQTDDSHSTLRQRFLSCSRHGDCWVRRHQDPHGKG